MPQLVFHSFILHELKGFTITFCIHLVSLDNDIISLLAFDERLCQSTLSHSLFPLEPADVYSVQMSLLTDIYLIFLTCELINLYTT